MSGEGIDGESTERRLRVDPARQRVAQQSPTLHPAALTLFAHTLIL